MGMRSSVALSATKLRNVLDESTSLLLLAIGELSVVITGGIDLSITTTYSLFSTLSAGRRR